MSAEGAFYRDAPDDADYTADVQWEEVAVVKMLPVDESKDVW